VLPQGQQFGSYRDTAGALHVLTRAPGLVALFEPGAWGDPSRVPTVRPALQQLSEAPLRAKLRADGTVQVLTRLIVSSQARLEATLLGRGGKIVQQGSRLGLWLHGAPAKTVRSELLAAGTFPLRLRIDAPAARRYRLRVTATDPYGRKSRVVLTVTR
jgi:hypothetical protein